MYKRLYQILETKEGEKEVFKLVKAGERRKSDLGNISYVKNDEGKVPVKKEEIKGRWQS